jgi:type II secretory pathway pseudopilin PulG
MALAEGEEGYSLIETLVALTLVVAVLVPILTALSMFFSDVRAERTHSALRQVETELARIETEVTTSGSQRTVRDGMIMSTRLVVSDGRVDALVRVAPTYDSTKTLVLVHRTLSLWSRNE